MLGQLDVHVPKKLNLVSELTPFTKNNSEWVIDLNVTWKIRKLGGNMGRNLCDIRFGDEFLDPTQKA